MLTPERLAFCYITIIEVVVLAIDTPKLIWKWLRISGLTLATLSRIGPVYRVNLDALNTTLSPSLFLAQSSLTWLRQKLSRIESRYDPNKRGESFLDRILIKPTLGTSNGLARLSDLVGFTEMVFATSWKNQYLFKRELPRTKAVSFARLKCVIWKYTNHDEEMCAHDRGLHKTANIYIYIYIMFTRKCRALSLRKSWELLRVYTRYREISWLSLGKF